MSNWNPRPMYASQPTIDPQDDRRIYMLNAYSFSDNGGEDVHVAAHDHARRRSLRLGRTRRTRATSIKLDDGGIGISLRSRPEVPLRARRCRCRSTTAWRSTTRVPTTSTAACRTTAAGRARARAGPTSGILNEHWSRLCGGDGFFAVPDPTQPAHRVLGQSQFLGLQRNDTRTWQSQDIRPGDPHGAIGDRRNWNTWGKSVPEQVLGNAMHSGQLGRADCCCRRIDPATIYAGGKHLFRSRDRGTTWEDLGDMTTGVDRATLPLMGKMPDEIDALDRRRRAVLPGHRRDCAESPRRKGVIYVGTDDGRFRMSIDDGKTWTSCRDRACPDSPTSSWFGGIEASRHARRHASTSRSTTTAATTSRTTSTSPTDGGKTFTSIAGDLPAGPRGAHDSRGRQEPERAVRSAPRSACSYSPNGGSQLGRAEEQHADAAVQRPGHPPARQRPGAGHARRAASGSSTRSTRCRS